LGADGAAVRVFRGHLGCAPKKLTWAGRAWATDGLFAPAPGTATQDQLDDDAAFWNIDPDLLRHTADDDDGVWPDNVPAVLAFLQGVTQWRVTALAMGGLLVTGLDYGALRAGLDAAEVEVTPALWGDIRMIEGGAMAAMNGKMVQ
jgi:Phage related hypothetical protein (DUF1799)